MIYLAFLLAFGSPAQSSSFEDLDPSVWDVAIDPIKGIYDAAILKDEHHIQLGLVDRYMAIRVLSEAGQAAASFVYAGNSIKKLTGRVVTRSGEIISLDGKADLIEKLAFKHRRSKTKVKLLLPPGLTRDCVVEYRWQEILEHHMSPGFYRLANDYFILEKSFSLDRRVVDDKGYLRYNISYSQGSAPIVFKATKTETGDFYGWSQIPPQQAFPYGNAKRDGLSPYIRMDLIETWADVKSDIDFWARTVEKDIIRHINEKAGAPSVYKKFIKKMKAGLPSEPVAAMEYLTTHFHKRVRDISMMTPSQKEHYKPENKGGNSFAQRMNIAFKQGYATRMEQGYLFYRIAKDCGVPFRLLLAADLDGVRFDPTARNPNDLNMYNPIFAVEEEGKAILFMPQMREYPFGTIPPAYRSVGCILLDLDKGQLQFSTIPADLPVRHQDNHTYTMSLDEQGHQHFELAHELTGALAAAYSRIFYTLTESEQKKQLFKLYEEAWPAWQFSNLVPIDPYNLEKPFTYQGSGEHQLEDLGKLIIIDPFPASFSRLSFPDLWPEGRSQHIYMPQPFTQNDKCQLTLPAGYQLRGDNSWQHENLFGSVSFQVKEQGGQLLIHRQVVLKRQVEHLNNEVQLKQFLDWTKGAFSQRLALIKGDNP